MRKSRYFLRRVGQSLLTVFIAATLTFTILRLLPGDPTTLFADPFMTPEIRQRMLADFGLDQPIPVQYVKFLWQLAQGNLGVSIAQRAPVGRVIMDALPWTLLLTGGSLTVTLLLALPLGLLSVWKRGHAFDLAIRGLTVTTGSMFVPWIALVLMNFFGRGLNWFPIGGATTPGVEGNVEHLIDVARHLALPVFVLAFTALGPYVLFLRTSMVEVMEEDYVRTARAKGVAERTILLRHAFKNALMPLVTMIGLRLGFLVSGAVLTETVFAYPGIGRLIFRSVQQHDYPVLQGAFLMLATTVITFNLITDIIYGLIDPRISYG